MGNQVGRIRQAADLKVRYRIIEYENNCSSDLILSDIVDTNEPPMIKLPEPGVETDEPPDSATLDAERSIERFEHSSVRVQCYCPLIQHVFMHEVISKINIGPMQYIFGASVCLSAIGGYALNPVLIITGTGVPLISATQLYLLVISIRDRHICDFDIVKSGVMYIAGLVIALNVIVYFQSGFILNSCINILTPILLPILTYLGWSRVVLSTIRRL